MEKTGVTKRDRVILTYDVKEKMFMKWALIVEGRVHETTDLDPEGRFHPSLEWRECPGHIDGQYRYERLRGFYLPEPEEPEINEIPSAEERIQCLENAMNTLLLGGGNV